MSQKLSAIERYRAAWKPNKRRIARFKWLFEKAVRDGDFVRMNLYWCAWHDAATPPRNLPIKHLSNTQLAH